MPPCSTHNRHSAVVDTPVLPNSRRLNPAKIRLGTDEDRIRDRQRSQARARGRALPPGTADAAGDWSDGGAGWAPPASNSTAFACSPPIWRWHHVDSPNGSSPSNDSRSCPQRSFRRARGPPLRRATSSGSSRALIVSRQGMLEGVDQRAQDGETACASTGDGTFDADPGDLERLHPLAGLGGGARTPATVR